MSNRNIPSFRRPAFAELKRRLEAPRGWMQVVAGPRQVGKTTMVKQVLDTVSLPCRYATADEPGLKDGYWICFSEA